MASGRVLLYAVAFVVGLGLGLSVATGVRGAAPAPSEQRPAPTLAGHAPANDDELALLRAEVAHLRAALDHRREAQAPAAETSQAAATSSTQSPVSATPVDLSGMPAQLDAEMARALAELGDYFVENRDQMAWYLASAYVSRERPREALAMLERLQVTDGDLYGMVSQGLEQAGDNAAAVEALERGMALDPGGTDLAMRLVNLDPARAVTAIDAALASQPPPGAPATRLTKAEALLALGRGAEARATLEALLLENPGDIAALSAFAEVDPAAAEGLLRQQMAEGDESGDAAVSLAQMLSQNGRAAEAIKIYEDLLAQDPDHAGARDELLALDPERAFQSMQRAASQQAQDPELWHALGEQWLQRGDSAQAIEAWLGAFERSPGASEWEERLLEHAPAQLIAAYEASVFGSEDDELWGDLADVYWRQGRTADARAAWQRAARIDPGDGEWSGKLAAVAAGQDPLQ